MSSHVSQSRCLAHIVPRVHLLQVLCFCVPYGTAYITKVQYLYFKPRRSQSECKSSSDVAHPTVQGTILSDVKCFLYFCACFSCIASMKSIINLLQDSTVVDGVSWVPRLTLLGLQTNRTYKLSLGAELVCR